MAVSVRHVFKRAKDALSENIKRVKIKFKKLKKAVEESGRLNTVILASDVAVGIQFLGVIGSTFYLNHIWNKLDPSQQTTYLSILTAMAASSLLYVAIRKYLPKRSLHKKLKKMEKKLKERINWGQVEYMGPLLLRHEFGMTSMIREIKSLSESMGNKEPDPDLFRFYLLKEAVRKRTSPKKELERMLTELPLPAALSLISLAYAFGPQFYLLKFHQPPPQLSLGLLAFTLGYPLATELYATLISSLKGDRDARRELEKMVRNAKKTAMYAQDKPRIIAKDLWECRLWPGWYKRLLQRKFRR